MNVKLHVLLFFVLSNVDDVTFYLSFLPIVQLFDFAQTVEEAVYS